MKNALYIRTVVRQNVSLTTLNSVKIKPIALAIVELCLTEGIRQSVQIAFNKNFLKFCNDLIETFQVNLKACFILTVNTASLSFWKLEGDNVILWVMATPSMSLHPTYHSLLSHTHTRTHAHRAKSGFKNSLLNFLLETFLSLPSSKMGNWCQVGKQPNQL